MENRYQKAANGFFDGDSAATNDETNETMSQTQSGNDDSNVRTITTGEERTIVANETSDLYIAVGHLKAIASAFVKAHPKMDLNWSGRNESELPVQVRYVKALHSVKGALGKRQREAEGNEAIGFGSEEWYAGTFGAELPTIETEVVDSGVLSTLEAQEGVATDDDDEPTYPEGSTDELGQGLPVRLPVSDGEVMPAFVTPETLDEALEAVEAIPTEPPVAPEPEPEPEAAPEPASGSEASAEGGSADAFFGTEEATPSLPDGVLEGYPNPLTLTVGEVRDLVNDLEDVSVVEQLINLELKNPDYEGGRDTALTALKGRRNRLNHQQEAAQEGASDDEVAEAVEGASEPAGESEAEAKAELANTLIADGMTPAKALEQVRSL